VIKMSDQAKKTMKLHSILAALGCEMKPNGAKIDVVSEDGSVVFQGDIIQLREEMTNNVLTYGQPIVHPSVLPFMMVANAIKGKRAAVLKNIQDNFELQSKLVEDEGDVAALGAVLSKLGVSVKRQVTASGDCGSGLFPPVDRITYATKKAPQTCQPKQIPTAQVEGVGCYDPGCGSGRCVPEERTFASVIPPTIVIQKKTHCEAGKLAEGCGVLPQNRIGALQEICQPTGQVPQYHMISSKGPDKTVFTCQVVMPPLDAIAVGSSKKAAKQSAAGNMLLMLEGKTPPKVEDSSSGGESFVYNESYVPSDLEDGKSAANVVIKKLKRWPAAKYCQHIPPPKPAPKAPGRFKIVVNQVRSNINAQRPVYTRSGRPKPVYRNRAARRAHLNPDRIGPTTRHQQVTNSQLERWGEEVLDLDFPDYVCINGKKIAYPELDSSCPELVDRNGCANGGKICPTVVVTADVPRQGGLRSESIKEPKVPRYIVPNSPSVISPDTMALMEQTEAKIDSLEKQTMDLNEQRK